MKHLVVAIIILWANMLFSQDLPEVVPPSPNAYQMTKYGEVPVNESTGDISLSVPLFNYSTGTLSVPISVNYSGNGVKTSQMSSIVGTNWSLSAGGVITRSVRDKVDEVSNTKYFLGEDDLLNMPQGNWGTYQDNTTFYGLMYFLGKQSTYTVGDDTQADIFNYSFPGYSGTFFFDENMQPHLVKYDKEIKIELIQNSGEKAQFKITTASGTSYYFGGNDATEITRSRSGQGANVTPWVPTSFFLYKIQNWNGDEIYIDYSDDGFFPPMMSNTYTMSRMEGYISSSTGGNAPTYHNDINSSITHNTIEYKDDKKYNIFKIRNNRDASFLSFEYDNNNAFLKSLDKLSLYESTNNKISQVSLNYIQPLRDNGIPKIRFFLEEVVFEDANGFSNNASYKFEYDSLDSFPLLNTHAVDHLGYYNGKESNGTLIPNNIDNEIIPQEILDPFIAQYGAQYFADREADFNYAKIGSLTKVIYPTKGFTSFEYESGQDGFKRAADTMAFNLDYLHDNYANDITTVSDSFTATIDGTAQVSFTSSSSAERTLGGVIAQLTVLDVTAGTTETSSVVVGSPHPLPNPPILNTGYATFTVVNGHQYQLTFSYTTLFGLGNPSNPFQLLDNGTRLLATATINYPIQGPPKDALGVRIKRIISKDNPTASPQIKRYYYSDKEHFNESQNFVISPRYLRYDKYDVAKIITTIDNGIPWVANQVVEEYLPKDILVSNNLGVIYEDDSSKKLFPVVTVSFGGDNFENGGEELFFKVRGNSPPGTYYYGLYNHLYEDSDRFYFSSTSNGGWENGTLYKKNTFKKVGTNFELITKTETHYKIDETKSYTLNNLIVNKNQGVEVHNFGSAFNPIEDLKIGYYKTYSKWHAVDQVKTTEYFDGDSIQTVQKYFYDTGWAGIPTRTETTSSAGETALQKMYYPDQLTATTALPGGTIPSASYYAAQNLKMSNQHRLSPIQTENYKNGTLLSRQRTNYKVENGLTLAGDIQASKGTQPLKDVIMYHKYDNYGNPLEVSKADGVHICYIWGYNNTKPIAKIVGINYNQIPAAQRTALANFNYTTGSEADLNALLDALRNALPNAMVSTFTYKPLIGVSTMTDAKGQRSFYHYDSFNRLQYVKDAQGHILKENEYHFRNN